MSTTAIFYRGMYKGQLKQMRRVQERDKSIRLFLQPFSRLAIAKLRDDPPTSSNPVTLYLSTNEEFAKLAWRA